MIYFLFFFLVMGPPISFGVMAIEIEPPVVLFKQEWAGPLLIRASDMACWFTVSGLLYGLMGPRNSHNFCYSVGIIKEWRRVREEIPSCGPWGLDRVAQAFTPGPGAE